MRRLLLLLALLFPFLALAQSDSQFLNIVLGPTGRPLAGATVTFCSDVNELAIPCTTTIALRNSSGGSIPNPTHSDSRGNVNVWATVGVYLMTVSGNGITPFRLVVNFPGGGGGATFPPGTPGTIIKYITSTTVGEATCTDDGINPTRCPNGMNTATEGYYAEWTAGVGGTTANLLVCRGAAQTAITCPAGTTTGVIGVARNTTLVGQTVLVCFLGKCSPTVNNATTAGHWLIPSTSVDGRV